MRGKYYPKSRTTPMTFCHSLFYRLVTIIVHVAILVIITDGSKSIRCDVTCMRGSWCFQEKCSPCPDGYFQDESGHQHTQCKPWTNKPKYLNFVIKTPGTRIHDVEWTCKEGYELFRYTPGEYECRKMVTTSPVTSVTTTPSTTSTSKSKERIESTTQRSSANVTSTTLEVSGKNEEETLGVVIVSVFVLLSIIVILGVLCYIRKKQIKSRNKRFSSKMLTPTGPMYVIEENEIEVSENPSPLLSETSMEDKDNSLETRIYSDESLTSDINFAYFSAIISRLGERSYNFIQHLHDPSGTFLAESKIHFCRERYGRPEVAYTYACLEWARKNKTDPKIRQYIVQALRDIGRKDISEEISLTVDPFENSTDIDLAASDSTNFERKMPLHQIFYRLVQMLGPDDSKKLLYRLPENHPIITVHSSLQFRMADHSSMDSCIVQTFVDWRRRNPQITNLQKCLLEYLNELQRHDVEEFLKNGLSDE